MMAATRAGEDRSKHTAARFTPGEFAEVVSGLAEGCPLIGGQAVALWAQRYGLLSDDGQAVTSADIDFWGSREDLKALAAALHRKPIFPADYEMTVWVGAIELSIQGKKTLVEFLHTVPGLDTNDPAKASVEQEYVAGSIRKTILVLSPISLTLAKLHALRHFNQEGREDESHLRLTLQASNRFLQELLKAQEIRQLLWNCERLITVSCLKPYRKLQSQHQIDLLSAIPIKNMRRENESRSPEDARRLSKFLEVRWRQLARPDI
jgi:hypothetical protein